MSVSRAPVRLRLQLSFTLVCVVTLLSYRGLVFEYLNSSLLDFICYREKEGSEKRKTPRKANTILSKALPGTWKPRGRTQALFVLTARKTGTLS